MYWPVERRRNTPLANPWIRSSVEKRAADRRDNSSRLPAYQKTDDPHLSITGSPTMRHTANPSIAYLQPSYTRFDTDGQLRALHEDGFALIRGVLPLEE